MLSKSTSFHIFFHEIDIVFMQCPRTPHNVAPPHPTQCCWKKAIFPRGSDYRAGCAHGLFAITVRLRLPATDRLNIVWGAGAQNMKMILYEKKAARDFGSYFMISRITQAFNIVWGAGARKNQAMIDFPSRNGPKRRTQLRWCIKIIVRFVHGKRMFLEWPKPHSVDFFWRAEMLYFLMILTNSINH